MAKARLVLSIEEDLIRKLKVKAAEQGMTVSEYVEEALKERLDEYGAEVWTNDYRQCIYCGKRIRGYGAICDDCKAEIDATNRERMAELWRKAKEELDRLMENWKKNRKL